MVGPRAAERVAHGASPGNAPCSVFFFLKRTQAYTPEFARAVVDAFVLSWTPDMIDHDDDVMIPERPEVWETARFEEAFNFFK